MSYPEQAMRIGELATRTGVSPHLLRAWELRHGLLTPSRSPGGYRLYGPQDEQRVREMVRLRAQGVPAPQAASAALSASRFFAAAGEAPRARGGPGADSDPDAKLRDRLVAGLLAFDDRAAHAAIDDALDELGVEVMVTSVILPVLDHLGAGWQAGEVSIAQEHYASQVVRTRLDSLALAWDSGSGPLALLACPSGEQHDLGLLAFGVVLGRSGWRVRFLGADLPLADLAWAAAELQPALIVMSAVVAAPLELAGEELAALPPPARAALRGAQLAVAGAGASGDLAERLGAIWLPGGPVEAARAVAAR